MMDQLFLKGLLEMAADLGKDPKKNWQELSKIQTQLSDAVYSDHEGQHPLHSRSAALETYCNALFIHTLEHDPALLPTLFPAFAILCGNREGTIIAKPDWSLASPVR